MRGISSLTGKSGVTKMIGGITMSRVTELEKALTTLFRKGTEVGYTETEIDEFLENIDYHALLQAVWNKAETATAQRSSAAEPLRRRSRPRSKNRRASAKVRSATPRS